METGKTKNQLIRELAEAQRRLAELEAAEAKRQRTEKALRASADKYRAIFERAIDSIVLIDLNTGEMVDFNDTACESLGYTREEFAKLKTTDIDPYINTIRPVNALHDILTRTGKYVFETKHITKSGEARDVSISANLVYLDGQELSMSICHDITERKKVEETLRESEERYRAIFEQASDSIAIVDLETRKILDFNDTACESLGYTREEFARLTLYDINAIETDEDVRMRYDNIEREGADSFDTKHRTKSGEIRDVHVNGKELNIGERRFGIGMWQDITERKRMDEKINHLNLVLRAIRNINQLITREKDRGRLLKGACEKLVENRGYHNAWIGLLNKHGTLDLAASASLAKARVPSSKIESFRKGMFNCCRQALQRPGVVIIENTSTDCGDCPFVSPHAERKVVTCRLEYEGRVYGIMTASSPVGSPVMDSEEADLFEEVVNDIALALHNIEMEGQHRHAEMALQASEEKYRALFTQAVDSILLIDPKNGKLVDFNDIACRRLGYTREELSRLNMNDIDPYISEKRGVNTLYENLARTGVDVFETKYRTKSGKVRDMLISARLVRLDGQELAMSICHDITERKRAQEALRESEEKYRAIFEQALNSISLIDKDTGKILDFNDKACQNLGYTREEFARLNLTDFAYPPEATEEHRETLLQEDSDTFETQHRTKSGEIRDVYVMARNVSIGDRSLIVNVWHDITEYKRAEEKLRQTETLQEIDRLRNQLLANVSHELRTPLASIKGFATMFLEYDRKLKSHEKRGYMETINRNVDRLTEFVDQLLDMSRLDAGALPLDKKTTGLNRLLRETVIEARVRTPSHRFLLDLPRRLPKIQIDASRIRQVLDNCICNAVNYSPAGTEITVSARKVNHEIMITISDQGIGIPEEDLPYVFDRMFRSRQRQLPDGGVGLGLAICKGLVQAHGGRIWIESEEGKGCRCFFTLPQQA